MHFSSDVVSVVIEFCDLDALVAVSQVSRAFREATRRHSLWVAQAFRVLFSSYEFFGYSLHSDSVTADYFASRPDSGWKNLLLKRTQAHARFCKVADQVLGSGAAAAAQLWEALQDPLPPLPALRREDLTFLTFFTDFLGNVGSKLDEEFFHTNLPALSATTQQAETSQVVSDGQSKGDARGQVLQLLPAIGRFFEVHCEASAHVLLAVSEPHCFLNEYCLRVRTTQWEAYCASMEMIREEFASFEGLVQQAAGKDFCITRWMAAFWRDLVFRVSQCKLVDCASSLFQELLKTPDDEETTSLLQR